MSRKRRNVFFSTVAAVVLFSAPVCSESRKEARAAELYARAAKVSDLSSPDTGPYLLRARFSAKDDNDGNVEGTYLLIWVSPSQWREEVRFPGYEQIRVGAKGKYWQVRNVDYEDWRAFQVRNIVVLKKLFRFDKATKVSKVSRKWIGSERVECVESERFVKTRWEGCFDVASGSLLRWRHWLQVRRPRSEVTEYGDYVAFKSKIVPRMIRSKGDGNALFEVQVEELLDQPSVDDSVFRPPDGAEAWGDCTDRVFVKLVPPNYPERARRRGRDGTVSIYAVIEGDGAVSGLKVVRSVGDDLDAAALEAVQQWKYNPANCSGEAMRSETIVNVEFVWHGIG